MSSQKYLDMMKEIQEHILNFLEEEANNVDVMKFFQNKVFKKYFILSYFII